MKKRAKEGVVRDRCGWSFALWRMLILLAVALTSQIGSSDVALSVGVGKGIMGDSGTPFERMVALGYQKQLLPELYIRPEGTYFLDISGQGKSSLVGSVLMGVEAKSSVGPELHFAIGPSYLQNPDQVLGGHFQFKVEFGAGISSDNVYLGVAWVHISSAGLEMPNHGRDFFPTAQLVVHGL